MKYGIAKYLKEKCNIDIHSDVVFRSSQDVYKAVMSDMKKKGFGGVQHKEAISNDDMKKLYENSIVFNVNTPCGLQKKVWFEITYFLCRRGRENLRDMTKETFAIGKDSQGREFVYQAKDEADKNHRLDAKPDDTIGEARMYARSDPMCPVASFKKYLQKLHPELNCLWQRPLESFEEDSVWFYKAPVGVNTLGRFMVEISKQSNLSKMYINHSVRATSITALDNAGVEARHVMRASGHKNESSIRSYACRLSENKKKEMSDCLSVTIGNNVSSAVHVDKKNIPNTNSTNELETEENVFPDFTKKELSDIFNSEKNMLEPLEKLVEPFTNKSFHANVNDTPSACDNPITSFQNIFGSSKFENCSFSFNFNVQN